MIDYELIDILPTQIYKFVFTDKDYLYNTLEILKQEDFVGDSMRLKTENALLHKKSEYKKLFDWFRECLQVVKENNRYSCDSLEISQSWANRYGIGGSIHPHVHPNSVVSGIFYLNDTEAGTVFGKINPWSVGNADDHTTSSSLWLSTINYGNDYVRQRVTPEVGCLYLFPSNLKHGTDINEHDERFTISFNSFPSGKIGDESMLASVVLEVK